MDADSRVFSDVVCSFCGRRNREVRVVRNDAGLILCQVCVAKAAQIFDDEVGVGDPKAWLGRWPLKQGSAGLAAVARPTGPRAVPFDVVIHSDWSTAPNKRWSAEARFVDDRWVASAPRLVPDPLALIAPGNSKLLGFDFPIGLPIAYASQAGIDDFRSFLVRASGRASIFRRPRRMRSRCDARSTRGAREARSSSTSSKHWECPR